MCGRYAITLPPEAVRAFFGYIEQPNFPPRYNIAPTQPIPIVCSERAGSGDIARHFRLVRWGFVPGFVKVFDTFRPFLNARSEDLVDKPSFRAAFRRRRCLVIADAYYAWQQRGRDPAQPFLVRRPDSMPFGMAGLFETWLGADGSELEGACIITTAACGSLAGVSPRMPVIIDEADFDRWLDPDELQADRAAPLMKPASEDYLQLVPVGTEVNKVTNDDATVQTPLPGVAIPQPQHRPPEQGSLF